MQLTYDLMMAASRDAGNRSMRNAGRTVWGEADYIAACECSARLWPHLSESHAPAPEPQQA